MRTIALSLAAIAAVFAVAQTGSAQERQNNPELAPGARRGFSAAIGQDKQPFSLVRFFGTAGTPDPRTANPLLQGKGFAKGPDSRFTPIPIFAGPPLIEPRGIVRSEKYLYISDSGRDESHDEPARIWRLDPREKKLELFYSGPLLVSSKWLWFVKGTGGRPDEIVVSDFGEEASLHSQGSGAGAKVFAIEVKPDGTAGRTRLIHQGLPLQNPQGITVVGNTIIVADTRAGETIHRADAPDVEFRNGTLFTLPLAGGAPVRIFADEHFVTLVGSCVYEENGSLYVRVWDIDGGRRDTSRFAWMNHSGFVSQKRAKVLSVDPLRLAPLEQVPLMEEFFVEIVAREVDTSRPITMRGLSGTKISDGRDRIQLESLNSRNISALLSSPTHEPKIRIAIDYRAAVGGELRTQILEFDKADDNPIGPLRDNKHAGSKVGNDFPRLDVSVDGLARTVTLTPPSGGISVNIWQGPPLVVPMASHFSWDGKAIWVTDLNGGPDGTGAVWQVPVPSAEEREAMYARMGAWTMASRARPQN